MSLYKRGNTWWVRFTAPNGERIRRSAGTEDKQLAQEYHDRLKVELWRIHRLGEKPRRTWQEVAVRWMRETDTKGDHHKDIAKLRWLDQFLRNHHLDEITRDVVDQIAAAKKVEASASTANRYLALLRAILRRARDDWEWIETIPRVRLFPEPKKRVRWITQAQAAKLVSELPPHLATMAAFTLATGLRQANVSWLRWDQVDLERRTAWIHADQSKSRRAIAVPLNEDAMRVLLQQRGTHPVFVFTYKDAPVARTTTKAWKAALARAGIEDFRWHDLRHTWASWHVQNGTSLQELMELGGWHSFEMVLRYAHLASEHLREAAQRVVSTNLAQHQKNGLKLIVNN